MCDHVDFVVVVLLSLIVVVWWVCMKFWCDVVMM